MKDKPNSTRTYDADGYRLRAAAVCVRDQLEQEVLLVSSSKEPHKWVIPGGGVEPDEQADLAALREVREEAGVEGHLGRCLGVFEVSNTERKHRTAVYVLVVTAELPEWEDSVNIGWLQLLCWDAGRLATAAAAAAVQGSADSDVHLLAAGRHQSVPAIVVYHGSNCGNAVSEMQNDSVETDQEEPDCGVSGDPLPTANGTGGGGNGTTGAGGHSSALQRQSRSLELVPGHPDRHHALPRQKMLMRSQAMREESSPPPDLELAPRYSNIHLSSAASASGQYQLRKFHSQGSADAGCGSPHLSNREFSGEIYTDSKGVDVERFLAEALNANAKDQAHLLKYEQDMINFIEDNVRTEFRFPPQSSYQRMLVHRAAVYFGLDHNVDPTGTCVIVTKTDRTRIPEHRFRDLLRDDGDEPKRLLKRDGILGHYSRSFDSQSSLESRRSKSFEERENDYRRTRTRIFNNHEEFECDGWHSSGRPSMTQLRRQMPSKAHSVDQPPRYARLSKADSLEGNGGGGVGTPLRLDTARPPGVAKSHSFGGYTGAALSRADSTASQPTACSGLLAKQDSSVSSVSRLSTSSGYKSASVSQVTLDSTPSPTNNQGYALEEATSTCRGDSQPVLWAVSNLEDVPAGSVIIDPHSGQPYLNADRTIYRYNPANPPQLMPAPAPVPAPAPAPPAPAPTGYQPMPLSLPAASMANTRYISSSGLADSGSVQFVQYLPAGTPPAAQTAPMQYPGPGLYPVVAGQQPAPTLQQSAGEKSVSELSQHLLSLGLADATSAEPGPLPQHQHHHQQHHQQQHHQQQQQQQYLLTYRGAPAGPQPPPPVYCLPGPVPLRYMYQPVLGNTEQPPQQYMNVYQSGAVQAAEAGYYVPSPSAGTPAVYPVPPFYGGPYHGTAGTRPTADLSTNGQQVLGLTSAAAQYAAQPQPGSAAGLLSGRLLTAGTPRLRHTDSMEEPPQLQPAAHSLPPPAAAAAAAAAAAYQRTLPLNAVRLMAPLRPGCQQQAAAVSAKPGRARRSRARSKPGTEPALTPTPEPGCVLEVDGCWPGLRRAELERHLQDVVCAAGGRIQYAAGSPPAEAALPSPPLVTAVFDTPTAAEAALLATRGARLRLRRPDH